MEPMSMAEARAVTQMVVNKQRQLGWQMHDCFFPFLADTPLISSKTTLLGLGVGDPSKAPGRLEQIDSCNAKRQESPAASLFCANQ